MKVLITGGAGFIGSHLADAFVKRGDQVTVIDNFSTGAVSNLGNSLVEVVEGDIRDSDLIDNFMLKLFDLHNNKKFEKKEIDRLMNAYWDITMEMIQNKTEPKKEFNPFEFSINTNIINYFDIYLLNQDGKDLDMNGENFSLFLDIEHD